MPGRTLLQARVAWLRRHPKDDLIVRLLRTEESLREQMDVAARLREQIILSNVERQRNQP